MNWIRPVKRLAIYMRDVTRTRKRAVPVAAAVIAAHDGKLPRTDPEANRRWDKRRRLRAAVAAAVKCANWFPEQCEALEFLATIGESREIEHWADAIEDMGECRHGRQVLACREGRSCQDAIHGWPTWFARRVARMWRRVAKYAA